MTAPVAGASVPALASGGVDRAAQRRDDDRWLEQAWRGPGARVIAVHESATLVRDTADGPRLAFLEPAAAPKGERFFLGAEQSTAYFAVAGALPDPADARAATLREVGALLPATEAALLVHAVALDNWHATHRCCPRCGTPTVVQQAGHVRRCPSDGSLHFPRTDPAVIMLVYDGADRCLLGRQASWPPRRFSTLAGFVEPGESAEQAVIREVAEEAGVTVTDVTYRASQPWPFPSSLMLGFRARAVTEQVVLGDGELEEARWFTRAELRAAAERGEVLRPPPLSIAYRLIADWLDEQV